MMMEKGEEEQPYKGITWVMEQEVCDCCGALLDYFGDCPFCLNDIFWDEDEEDEEDYLYNYDEDEYGYGEE